jgi:hypothetical protein
LHRLRCCVAFSSGDSLECPSLEKRDVGIRCYTV